MRKLTLTILALLLTSCVVVAGDVSATSDDRTITLSNGLIRIAIDRNRGAITAIQDLTTPQPTDLGLPNGSVYWDANADLIDPPAAVRIPKKGYFRPGGEKIATLTVNTPQRAEVTVKAAHSNAFAFDAEYHFALLKDVSGVYAYVIVSHPSTLPAARLYQTRFVSRTVTNGTLDYWSTGPDAFVKIPTAAVTAKVMDATYRLADGTVKSKYLNSVYWAKAPVYGVLGHLGDNKAVGLWMIEASPEYHNGGPVKQGQTVHDNVLLRVLQSVHFGASPVAVDQGEAWQKTYGPFLLYVNHAQDAQSLWADANDRQKQEAAAWPYSWVDAPQYVKARGTVTGQLHLQSKTDTAAGAWVILGADKSAGEWTAQSKGYQFWTHADSDGHFTIPKVIPGNYTLYASGGNQPEDFSQANITVIAGQTTNLGVIEWKPVTHGQTLWQIGTFDHNAGEFRNGDDARQYQMFTAYPKQFPNDVDFIIGKSDIKKDWNYAQWSWYAKDPKWRIKFDLTEATTGTATLTFGFASAMPAHGKVTDLRVAINNQEITAIHLPKTGTAGYRGGVQDSPYHISDVSFDASLLHAGTNEIELYHADAEPFHTLSASTQPADDEENTAPPGTGFPGQVMYDAIRLDIQK